MERNVSGVFFIVKASTDVSNRTPVLITDKEGRIIVILAGRPTEDESYVESMERLQCVLAETRESLRFGKYQCVPAPSSGATENRRGNFKTAAVGVSYGGGQKVHYTTLSVVFFDSPDVADARQPQPQPTQPARAG